jgi:GTPase
VKTGFVNIFGKPNAGKSTLLNALLQQKLAITSPKVQTTRNRIKAIITEKDYQIIFSDTPGIITPEYKLHEKMMRAVESALEDADIALFLVDARDFFDEADALFGKLKLRCPKILVINKTDTISKVKLAEQVALWQTKDYIKEIVCVSALNKIGLENLLQTIVKYLPEGEPFFDGEELTDLPTKFFVSEIIREKIYELYHEEIPYHSAVLVQAFKEKNTLTKISADIIVQRESQKQIIIGAAGKNIKKLGTLARVDIEAFIERKVFLELFVKVRPKWRDNENQLKEYGLG